MKLNIDQRPFKQAVLEAINSFKGPESIDEVLALYDAAVEEHPNYLNVDAVRSRIKELLEANRLERTRKLVNNAVPDETATKPALVATLAFMGLVGLVVLVIGGAILIFLWQHFFG